MKNFFLVLGLFLLTSTNVHSEYILESANCTLKRSNCGAYLYNNKTGATYFCDFDKCKEIMPAFEDSMTEEVKGSKKSKKSKIPKFKKKKKSKIPKFKKTE